MCDNCNPVWPSYKEMPKIFAGDCYCGVASDHMIFPYPNDPLEKTTLYRYFDHSGRLLYVGISKSLIRRMNEHHESSDWSDIVDWIKCVQFDSRCEALDAEWVAIRDEDPEFNVVRRPPPYWKPGQTEIPQPYVDTECRFQESCSHKEGLDNG